MAKGDVNGAAPPVVPKIDQYSVMHKIMDAFGGGAGSIAPSDNFQAPNPSSMGMSGGSQSFLPGDNFQPNFHAPNSPMPRDNWGVTGGQFGTDSLNASPSLVPTNPQDMIRRTMMGKGQFGQM